MIKERDNLQKVASDTKSKDAWNSYKKMRNIINNRLKYEEKYYQKHKIMQCNGEPKSTWKTVKSVLNWNSTGSPDKLFHEGTLFTKSQEIGDCQNKYFIQKIKAIQEDLPPPKTDPLSVLQHLVRNNKSKMTLSPVAPEEVLKIVSHLTPML